MPFLNMLQKLLFKLFYFQVIILFMKSMSGRAQILIPTREMRIEQFDVCPNSEHLPIVYKDIIITQSSRDSVEVSAKLIFKELVGAHPLKLTMELTKCSSKEEVASCEYYTRISVKDCCDFTNIFKTFMKNSTLPNCPIKAGVYYFNKARLDLDDYKFLPLFDSYWKIKSIASEQKKVVACVMFEFSLKQTTKKLKL